MIIGIDGNEANVERRAGVGEYAFELLRQFKHLTIDHIRFTIYLKEKPLAHMPIESENWQYRIVKPARAWTQVGLPFDLFLHKPRPDVFFTPTHYAPRFAHIPTVISIMDLSYLYFPELFRKRDLYKLKNWSSYSVKKANLILTISQSSKDDIIKEYKIPGDKIIVTYLGIKTVLSSQYQVVSMDELKKKYGIEKDFILFVGTLQPRKNIARLIEAFSNVIHTYSSSEANAESRSKFSTRRVPDGNSSSSNNNLQLVIIGKKGWQYDEILAAPSRFNVADKVKFLEFVPDVDLSAFYKHALFFILPSLYEGFGLPVLEAMSYECPVITSNVSSLPEAGGDAALYVDPQNTDDIAEKMKKLLENEKLRKELIEKGKEQVKKFSWEKAARETLSVLEKIGKRNTKT